MTDPANESLPDVVAVRLTEIEALVLDWMRKHGFYLLSSFAERHNVCEMRVVRTFAVTDSLMGRVHLLSVACPLPYESELNFEVWVGVSLEVNGKLNSELFERALVGGLVATMPAAEDVISSRNAVTLTSEWQEILTSSLQAIAALETRLQSKIDDEQAKDQSIINLIIYTAAWDRDSREAKWFLKKHGIPYKEIDIDKVPGATEEIIARTGSRILPQFVIDGRWLNEVGSTQLPAVLRALADVYSADA